jgi:hypothetical protein
MGADNQAARPAGRLRHYLFPICEYLRHLRHLRLKIRISVFGLRISGRQNMICPQLAEL